MARLLRRLLLLALLGAATAAAVRALRARRPTLTTDSGPEWPPLDTAARTEAGPVVAAALSASAAPWVEPVEGACPEGYPVKANSSGIYHVPGGQFYERTVPERCYADPHAAEADGYRAARR